MSEHAKQASAQNSRPFFILGAGRSGTSLLSRMLNQHPNLAVPPESHLYSTFHPWLGYYGSLAAPQNRANLVADIVASGPLRDWSPRLRVDEVLAHIEGDDFGAVVDGVMRAWAAKQGKGRWGEKTPRHVHYWRQISADFKASPVIHVVRDGRDVALSMIEARFGPKSLYSCAKGWKGYLNQMEDVRNGLPHELFFEVTYEDMLDNTRRVLREVCVFLGERYAPEMLDYYHNGSPYPTDAHNRENLAKPVIVENKEKWRSRMTRDEIRVFEAVAGGALARYGYARAIDDALMPKPERWVRRYLEAPYRRSIGRLKDHKGQKERLILLGLLSRRVGAAAVTRLTGRGFARRRLRFGVKDATR
jgi:hypothetical protein